ncbi:MAG: VOC family protein [Betaproteobacteria bacterium]|nr:VOC family protein [Betaproteobacteria bacterium]
MNAPHIDHIGIIVADLEAAIERLGPLFGGAPVVKELMHAGLRVAEFHAANITVELLQYSGANDTFARRVMGGQLGLNHLSARVEDVQRSIAELRAAGLEPMEGFPRQGAHGRVAFFKPDALTGLLFEICEPDADAARAKDE